MTTLYELSCGYTKLGIGTAPSSAPTIAVVDSANNILVASGTAVTALTNLPGAYRYSYSGADGLIVYGLFHTADLTVDQYDIFVSALVGPGVRDIQTRFSVALVSGRMDASVGAMANEVITAAAHDESTAYPLKAADTGATILARPGDAMELVATVKHKIGSSGYDHTTDSLEALGEKTTAIDTVTNEIVFTVPNQVDANAISGGTSPAAIDVTLTANHGAGAWGVGIPGGTKTLTYTLTNSVTGLPVEGATVELYATAGMTTIIDSKVTDVFGVVTFSNLVAGTYYLKITKTGFTASTDTEVVS